MRKRKISTFLLTCTCVASSASAQSPQPHVFPQFRPIFVGVAGAPRAIVTADFDNDGDMDFATANIRSVNPSSVTIALWTGPGPSGEFRVSRIPLPEGPIALTAADLNRDGAKDLAVVSADAAIVSILHNNGAGVFSVVDQITTGAQPRDIVAADFNRDGLEDLAIATMGCDCIGVARQAPNGEFLAPDFNTAGPDPWGLATADFDRDGILDLVVTYSASHSASVLYGHGDGSFGLIVNDVPQRFETRVGRSPRAVTVGDFNRDGRLDFATANTNTTDMSLTVVLATGDRSFAPPRQNSIHRSARDVETVDVNGDGKLDLLAAEPGTNLLLVLIGKGNGCFSPPSSTGCETTWTGFQSAQGARAVAYADFNRDGRVDVAVANQSGSVTIFFNESQFHNRR